MSWQGGLQVLRHRLQASLQRINGLPPPLMQHGDGERGRRKTTEVGAQPKGLHLHNPGQVLRAWLKGPNYKRKDSAVAFAATDLELLYPMPSSNMWRLSALEDADVRSFDIRPDESIRSLCRG